MTPCHAGTSDKLMKTVSFVSVEKSPIIFRIGGNVVAIGCYATTLGTLCSLTRLGRSTLKIAWKKTILAMALAASSHALAAPAQAGEAELALLSNYIGQWRGDGALVGGDKPEAFRCRLNVAKGNQQRINYTGRCTLVDTTLSISGTIAYSDTNRRYEAAMSSNAGFTGMAVGQIRGKSISFDLSENQRDRGGSDVRIGSNIVLANNTIVVNFEVEFNNSGDVLTAKVPFSR